MIAYALSKAPQLFNIRGGFKRFESIEVNLLNETLKLENELFHPSKIVIPIKLEYAAYDYCLRS